MPVVASEDVTGIWSSGSEGGREGGSLGSGCSALDRKRSNLGMYVVRGGEAQSLAEGYWMFPLVAPP